MIFLDREPSEIVKSLFFEAKVDVKCQKDNKPFIRLITQQLRFDTPGTLIFDPDTADVDAYEYLSDKNGQIFTVCVDYLKDGQTKYISLAPMDTEGNITDDPKGFLF